MTTAFEHPLVAAYLRTLDAALASRDTGTAAGISERLRARIAEALPPGSSDETVAAVLAVLGLPAELAGEAGPLWLQATRPGPSRWRRAGHRIRRMPLRAWLVIAPLTTAVCLGLGTLIFWQVQPALGFYSGSYEWWYATDSARDVTTEAANVTQDTVPLRPGQSQGFAILIYNPSDITQRILGVPLNSISPGAPTPPQILVATTTPIELTGEPHAVRYRAGGPIPPHSYRWVRVMWRSYRCYLNGVGATQGTNELTVRVQLGWITRTEAIQLPTEFAVSGTKANVQAAYCRAHHDLPVP